MEFTDLPFEYVIRYVDQFRDWGLDLGMAAALEDRDRQLEDYLADLEGGGGVRNSGELLRLTAAADSIASGGDYLSFDTMERRVGFNTSIGRQATTLPHTATYAAELWFGWDSYTAGGTVEVEINGTVRRTHPDSGGGAGSKFEWTVLFDAEKGDTLRIKVTQSSGSAQTAAWDLSVVPVEPIGAAAAELSVITSAAGASAGDNVEVSIPTAVNAGDLLVAFGLNVTHTRGVVPTLKISGVDATYFLQESDQACGYWVLDGTETSVACNANTPETDNDTLRLAFVVFRGQSSNPTLETEDEGAASPLSAAGTGSFVVAFGRGTSPGSTASGDDALTLTGHDTLVANQTGPDPLTAGYGDAATFGLSWADADITSAGLYIVSVS